MLWELETNEHPMEDQQLRNLLLNCCSVPEQVLVHVFNQSHKWSTCSILLPQVARPAICCRSLRHLQSVIYPHCRPVDALVPQFSGYCYVGGNDRKTSRVNNKKFTNTPQFVTAHKQIVLQLRSDLTEGQGEALRVQSETGDYIKGDDLKYVPASLRNLLCELLLCELEEYSYAADADDCLPALLLGKETSLQFQPGMYPKGDFTIKPRDLSYYVLHTTCTHATIQAVIDMGVTVSSSNRITESEDVKRVTSVMLFDEMFDTLYHSNS